MKKLALVCLLTGCLDQPETLVELCGPRPLQPGITASFTHYGVSMSRQTYQDLVDWADEVKLWSQCVAEVM